MSDSHKLVLRFGLPAAFLVALQLVPYGHDRSNPPDGQQPAWDSRQTEDLAQRACYDCHSNRTRWPWYASVAPASWRIQHHVREGREKLNFTAFDPGNETTSESASEAGEAVTKGKMPPRDYLLMHPEAWLSGADRRALANGLDVTFAAYSGPEESEESEERGRSRKD